MMRIHLKLKKNYMVHYIGGFVTLKFITLWFDCT